MMHLGMVKDQSHTKVGRTSGRHFQHVPNWTQLEHFFIFAEIAREMVFRSNIEIPTPAVQSFLTEALVKIFSPDYGHIFSFTRHNRRMSFKIDSYSDNDSFFSHCMNLSRDTIHLHTDTSKVVSNGKIQVSESFKVNYTYSARTDCIHLQIILRINTPDAK